MVLDTSAVVAIVLQEPGFEKLIQKVEIAETVGIGAPTLHECGMVLASRLSRDPRTVLQAFLRRSNASVIAFGSEHFEVALEAFLRYGKRRHAASLNFGDCLSYAIASVAGAALLYIGDDFTNTDITAA